MTEAGPPPERPRARRVVRLPGFVAEEEIGAGDVVQRLTTRVGIKPCGGCARRAEAMNRWLAVGGRATGGR